MAYYPEEMKLRIAGHTLYDHMIAGPGPASTAKVVGVTLRFPDDRGGWVVDFEDLERLYKRALELRQTVA